jgi:hypothetical protein
VQLGQGGEEGLARIHESAFPIVCWWIRCG